MFDLELSNIGSISNVKIEFNKLNLIAGKNNTSKSTIGKSLYSLYSYNMYKYLGYDKKDKIDVIKETLCSEFYDSANNVYTNNNLVIKTSDCIYDELNKEYKLNNDIKVIFLESLISKIDHNYIDYLNENISSSKVSELNKIVVINKLLHFSNDKVIEKYNKVIKDITDELEMIFAFHKIKDGKYVNGSHEIPFNSQSSGIKSLYYIYEIVKRGHIDDNTILILDEPEDELHPDWQYHVSSVITKIANNLNAMVIITTHSSEQIESVFSFMSHKKLLSELTMFVSKKEDNNIKFINYGNDPIEVYESLNSVYDKIDGLGL